MGRLVLDYLPGVGVNGGRLGRRTEEVSSFWLCGCGVIELSLGESLGFSSVLKI